jgi:hypothetical protein
MYYYILGLHGRSEIDDFDGYKLVLPFGCVIEEDDVFEFDIAVYDVVGVEVGECAE